MLHNKLHKDSKSTVSCLLLLLLLLTPLLSSCSFMNKAFSDDPVIEFKFIGGVESSNNSSNY